MVQTLHLSALTAAQGFRVQGDAFGDRAGYSVASAGDVNGDGLDDIIVGAFCGDDGGTLAGEAYVIYGRTGTRDQLDLGALSVTDGFVIQGDRDYDRAGSSVASAGDVNGDGLDDVIVGAPYGRDGGYDAGQAYVIYGRTDTRGRIDLGALSVADGFVIQGDRDYDRAGSSVASAGDMNGDGLDDMLVGASSAEAGKAYVIYGTTGPRGRLDLGAFSR